MSVIDEQGQPYRKFNHELLLDRTVDEFIGIARGVLADGYINQAESEFILTWIEQNKTYADQYPINVLYKRLQEMLEDGILDDNEKVELIDILKSITGDNKELSSCNSSSSLPIDNPQPSIKIEGNSFVFTGVFTIGTRKKCEEIVHELGGEMHKTVNNNTNYLVIGDIGSDQWIHSSHGRKIEKAIKLRDEKDTGLVIISEHHWMEYI